VENAKKVELNGVIKSSSAFDSFQRCTLAHPFILAQEVERHDAKERQLQKLTRNRRPQTYQKFLSGISTRVLKKKKKARAYRGCTLESLAL
jgi:hypothetical protein